MLSVFQILATTIIGLIGAYLYKIWDSYNFFKKRGIKTPDYELLFGNFRQIRKGVYSDVIREWTKQFGKVFGYYEGHLPVLVTSDLDIIQEIFIKQYANFSARKKMPLDRRENSPFINLFLATKSRWKRMRVIMNPTFSTSKLRELSPIMSLCTDRLINVLKNKKEVNAVDFYKRFTMDTIWNCAFGLDIDVQNQPDNEYFTNCELVFSNTWKLDFRRYLGIYFHEFKEIMVEILTLIFGLVYFISPGKVPALLWIRNRIGELVDRRKMEKINRKDFIQLLIDASAENSSLDSVNNNSVDLTNINLTKNLSTDEVKMNLSLFMLAGYETTSTTLSYCTYILAKYPDEQQKLYDEISSYYIDDANRDEANLSEVGPTADNVNKLEYLDMFIKEVLRMYPIGNSIIARRCTNPTKIKGIDIHYDMTIAVDVLSIHYDVDLYGPVDPNEFYPQRFAPENKRNPLAFLAFGIGPRNCIGMKFALIELKIGLIKLLLNYEIKPGKSFPEKMQFNEGLVRTPKDGVNVLFTKREASLLRD